MFVRLNYKLLHPCPSAGFSPLTGAICSRHKPENPAAKVQQKFGCASCLHKFFWGDVRHPAILNFKLLVLR
jgi:hypothetical protein